MKKTIISTLFLLFSITGNFANDQLCEMTWNKVAQKMPAEWYASNDAQTIAQTVISFQTDQGGWPKNVQYHIHALHPDRVKPGERICGGTFDNGATITELRFLAKVYQNTRQQELKTAFNKGVEYIINAQYTNGGWPQFWPVRQGRSVAYSGCITYNDGAFTNIMTFLHDIIKDKKHYLEMTDSKEMAGKIRKSFNKGIECILKTQIVINGEPTVWCAQHDAVTLAPAKARAYELPSFSGVESVDIVRVLMAVDNPSPEIIRAVKGAVRWFENHRIKDMAFERYMDDMGEKDARIVRKPGNTIWARFYDLDTGEPFVCDRDGVKRKSIYNLSKERRGGYSWYTTSPDKLFDEYASWKAKNKI